MKLDLPEYKTGIHERTQTIKVSPVSSGLTSNRLLLGERT